MGISYRRLAGALYFVAVLIMGIRAGQPESLWWWLVALPFDVWIASPVLGGLYVCRLLSGVGARTSYLAALAIIGVGGFLVQWHTMFIGPSDAQNALILVFVPFYQWLGVGLAFGISKLLEIYVFES